MINYVLKRRRNSRNIRLSIHRDGAFVVTAPYFASTHLVEHFIDQKSQWIQDKMKYFKSLPPKLSKAEKKLEYLRNKERALILVENRITYFNKFYNFKIHKISIRNQSTRWGSCSKGGTINFNYRIALISEKLADYIVVHELCHLAQMNHSKNFWNLVMQTVPDYKERRKELRKIGMQGSI